MDRSGRSAFNKLSAFQESQRLAAVQAPVIPVIADLIRANPGTISLGQGVVHYPPPPQAREALEEFWADPDNHTYKPVAGLPQLVAAFHDKLRRENGIDAPLESIIVTAGGNMGFINALLAICDPGDEVILPTPYYFNHEMAMTLANCKPVLAPTDSGYQLDIERLESAVTPRTRAIVTVSPNNPTGAVYSEESLRTVNELCRQRGIYHISDEAYEYFTYDGAKHFSCATIQGSEEHTLSLFSLSKSYGFASWRIGCMIVPKQLLTAVKKIQDTNLICAPVISQYAALGALKAGRAYRDPLIHGLAQVRESVWAELQKLGDICEAPKSAGAFYFLIRCRTNKPSFQLARELIEQHKIAVIPGNAFGVEEACALRLAYGALKPETVAEGMRRLVSGLRALVQPKL